MTASQIMTPNVLTVNAHSFCDAPARLMWENDIGSVPVVDEARRVVGIVTDRDICMGAYTSGRPLAEISVATVMAKNVICARQSDSLAQVEQLMSDNQIRRIPVIDDDGRLIGIIAFADLARRRARVATEETASEHDIAETIGAVSQPQVPHQAGTTALATPGPR